MERATMSHDNLRKEKPTNTENIQQMLNTKAGQSKTRKHGLTEGGEEVFHKGAKQITLQRIVLDSEISRMIENSRIHEGCMTASCPYQCYKHEHKGQALGRVKELTTEDIIALRYTPIGDEENE
jgi:hypothetical protein